ncbi:hypothetical protein CcaverHIS002_0101700 [Cutaneotrichosporon cavernicola]|nr:hypothetical protein CcaverHIS002_0101700 [Cutaneotrichosporon cavernicola]
MPDQQPHTYDQQPMNDQQPPVPDRPYIDQPYLPYQLHTPDQFQQPYLRDQFHQHLPDFQQLAPAPPTCTLA